MRYVKILGGLLGALILGAAGSGVWDLLLKRIVLWIWDRLATFAALSFSAIGNIPYQDAARGSPHDTVLGLVFLVACYLFGAQMAKIDPVLLWQASRSATPEEKARALRQSRRVQRILAFGIFFFASLQIAQVRVTYRVVDAFGHNIAALTPLVDAKAAAEYRLAFSRMKSVADYEKLMERMRERATAAGVELPR